MAGFLIGGSGSESEGGELPNSASAGNLALSFPSDWKRVSEEPDTPGMRFSQPIVLSAGGMRGARLIVGEVDGAGPTLLPRTFLARLGDASPEGETVKVGRLEAFRYAGLEPRGATGRITAYVAPTTEGIAAVACVAPPAAFTAFAPECERVATTLELSGGKPLALGPREDYARAARTALGRLDGATGPAAGRLRRARTPSVQAAAAADLADAYAAAARALAGAPVGPYERDANSRLVRSLRQVASAYERAARAARGGDEGAYAAAGRAVRRGAAGLRRAQAGLRGLGYSVG